MIVRSRPIRFLLLVVGGWIGVRAVVLWPVDAIVPELARIVTPPAAAAATRRREAIVQIVPPPTRLAARPDIGIPPRRSAIMVSQAVPASIPRPGAAPSFAPVMLALAAPVPLAELPPPGAAPPPAFRASRLSGSAWAILRPGGRATPFASQLGGSQAGVRLAYAIDRPRRLSIVARAATAIGTRQQEAGIGLDWKPTALPIHLVAEQRIGIAGIRGGQALGAIGGVGPAPIGAGFRVEAYGQAGAILRRGSVEGFADGQLRVTRPVLAVGMTMLEAGGGAWGAAQRGAARVDLGPTVGATLPIGQRRLRIAIDWRQRIAGAARPGSGPAVSVGTDF